MYQQEHLLHPSCHGGTNLIKRKEACFQYFREIVVVVVVAIIIVNLVFILIKVRPLITFDKVAPPLPTPSLNPWSGHRCADSATEALARYSCLPRKHGVHRILSLRIRRIEGLVMLGRCRVVSAFTLS